MAHQAGFLVDIKRCSGCKGCVNACKAENNTRPQQGAFKGSVDYRRVVFTSPGRLTNTDTRNQSRFFVSTACYHCTNPACMRVCPARAIYKRGTDGVVLIRYNMCVGCRSCQFACPYSAPRFNSVARKMQKCTLCQHRLAAGLQPACVQTCVTKALRYKSDMTHDSSTMSVAPPDGPPGGPSGLSAQNFKRDAATYAALVGTSSTKHSQTLPNVGFNNE